MQLPNKKKKIKLSQLQKNLQRKAHPLGGPKKRSGAKTSASSEQCICSAKKVCTGRESQQTAVKSKDAP